MPLLVRNLANNEIGIVSQNQSNALVYRQYNKLRRILLNKSGDYLTINNVEIDEDDDYWMNLPVYCLGHYFPTEPSNVSDPTDSDLAIQPACAG